MEVCKCNTLIFVNKGIQKFSGNNLKWLYDILMQ